MRNLVFVASFILLCCIVNDASAQGRRDKKKEGQDIKNYVQNGKRDNLGQTDRKRPRGQDFGQMAQRMIKQFDKNDDGALGTRELASALRAIQQRRQQGPNGRDGTDRNRDRQRIEKKGSEKKRLEKKGDGQGGKKRSDNRPVKPKRPDRE